MPALRTVGRRDWLPSYLANRAPTRPRMAATLISRHPTKVAPRWVRTAGSMRIHPDTQTRTKSATINERHIHRNPIAESRSRPSNEVSTRPVASAVTETSDRADTKFWVSTVPGTGISVGLDCASPIRTPSPREGDRLVEAAPFGSNRDPSPRPSPEVDIAGQGFGGGRTGNNAELSQVMRNSLTGSSQRTTFAHFQPTAGLPPSPAPG